MINPFYIAGLCIFVLGFIQYPDSIGKTARDIISISHICVVCLFLICGMLHNKKINNFKELRDLDNKTIQDLQQRLRDNNLDDSIG